MITTFLSSLANFLDEVALESAGSSNPALRATACHYQNIVMEQECRAGQQEL